MEARRRLQKLVIDFLTASCGSSSHILSNALVPRCSSIVDSDICASPTSTPKHGSQADLNEVTDARSRRSLEDNALRTKSRTIYAYFNIAERNLSYL